MPELAICIILRHLQIMEADCRFHISQEEEMLLHSPVCFTMRQMAMVLPNLVMSIPTLKLVRGDELIESFVGAMSAEELEEWLSECL